MSAQRSLPWAWPYLGCATFALSAGAMAAAQHPEIFRAYFGAVPPSIVLAALGVLGLIALAVLRVRGFVPSQALRLRSMQFGALTIIAFTLSAIGADIVWRFARDLNVAPPWSLLFYPAMGFSVEVAFHAAPLALIGAIAKSSTTMWPAAILAVSAIEPLFQVRAATAIDALTLFVAAQVFAFNVFELMVFRRFGFTPMYALRLGYYLGWHVLWGAARVAILF